MPTQTLTRQAAQSLLDDATRQHSQLARKFSELQNRLTTLEPGTDAFTTEAHRAADLKSQLTALTAKIQELTLQATTEQERQAKADHAAAAAKAQAELEAQAAKDLAKVEQLIETINTASDVMAAAIAELASPSLWATLRQTGDLNFDGRNRSTQRLLWELPFVVRTRSHIGPVARLQWRYESNIRDRV